MTDPVIPSTLTTPPTTPNRGDRATFAARSFALDEFNRTTRTTELNTLQTQTYNNALAAYESAVTATSAPPVAPPWVSGQSYLVGAPVYSILSRLTYRREIAGAGTTDPSLDPTNWSVSSKQRNAQLVADAMLKIRLGTAVIVCQGDSLTYGYDIVSGGTIPATLPHTANHVPLPYPETLQIELNRVFCTTGTVVTNRGYAGHTALSSFNYWTTDPNADLVFLMLGTNDCKVTTGLSLTDYVTYMTAIIERYNAWGAGVVIITSPSLTHGTGLTTIESYRAASQSLAKQLGCPVFRGDEVMLNNTYTEVYSDTVHFNQSGYTLLANSLAAFITAGGMLEHPNIVTSARTLLCNSENHVATDGAISIVGAGSYVTQELQLYLNRDSNDKATMAFYLDADAAYVSAVARLSVGQVVTFDSDSLRSISTREGVVAATTSSYTITEESAIVEPNSSLFLGQVIGRGWHSVTITSPTTAAGSATNGQLFALHIAPRLQQECSTAVYNATKRSFSLYDPVLPALGATPAASGTTSFVLPKGLFGNLFAQTSLYVSAAFVGVEIFHISANVPSYTRCVMRLQSGGVFSVQQITSVGANPVVLTGATVTSALHSVSGNVTFTVTRPATGYMEMRFEVPDMPQMLNVALM